MIDTTLPEYKVGKLYVVRTKQPLDLMVYNSLGQLEYTGCYDRIGTVNDGDVVVMLSHRRLKAGFGTKILTPDALVGGIKDYLADNIEELFP